MKQWTRLVRYAVPYWFALIPSVVLMVIAGAAHGMIPLLIGPVLTRVLNPGSVDVRVSLLTIHGYNVYLDQLVPGQIHNIWTMVAFAILATFLTKGLCDYAGSVLVNYVGLSAVMDLRQKVFDKVLKQGAHFFELHSTGRLMSSIMNDIDKIQVAVSHMLADFFRQSFSASFLLAVVIIKDWKLAIVSLALFPFVLLPTARLGRRVRRVTRTAQDHQADLTQVLQEALSGHQVVKSFGTEAYESKRFWRAGRRLRSASVRYTAHQAIASPLIEFFGALIIVALLAYARNQIKSGALSAKDFVSFLFALVMLFDPVKRLTGIYSIFQQAIGASQRVFEYLQREEDIRSKPGAPRFERFEDSIVFDNVCFRYPSSPNGFLLNGIQLEVKAGDVVALVGPSGAGKTTLVNLLPRFYDVSAGRVLIDGRDVRDLDLRSLRERIGIVAQDTFLFNDTVADNIRYGRSDAPMELVERAARSALAEEFILALPQGYDTVIGERGTKLSGGQRQRIAIARALLKNAPILILDEATSHLDTESEMLVQSALANLIAGRTVIVIAHRLSTVRRADKIVVLDEGRVSEIGTHEELVEGGGIYQRLHALQFLDVDLVANGAREAEA